MYPFEEPATPPADITSTAPSSDVGQAIGAVAQQAAQQAGQLVNQVQEQAGAVAQQVQGQARSQLSEQKDQVANSLSGLAQSARQIGDQMRQSGQAPLAHYADATANQIQQTADYLHNRTISQLIGDIEDFARRQPAVFIAGGVVLGMLAARFIKSSNQQHS
jgi:ABC-type transporter Mla subunit MlaD